LIRLIIILAVLVCATTASAGEACRKVEHLGDGYTGAKAAQPRFGQVLVGGGDLEIGARQRRFQVVDQRGEEIPAGVGRARHLDAQLVDGGAQARARPEPGGQHVP